MVLAVSALIWVEESWEYKTVHCTLEQVNYCPVVRAICACALIYELCYYNTTVIVSVVLKI